MNQRLRGLISLSEDLTLKIMIGLRHIESTRSQGRDVRTWETIIKDLKSDLVMVNNQIAHYREFDETDFMA